MMFTVESVDSWINRTRGYSFQTYLPLKVSDTQTLYERETKSVIPLPVCGRHRSQHRHISILVWKYQIRAPADTRIFYLPSYNVLSEMDILVVLVWYESRLPRQCSVLFSVASALFRQNLQFFPPCNSPMLQQTATKITTTTLNYCEI